jgi:RhtB (resistance to homoserine/threonine) family protein
MELDAQTISFIAIAAVLTITPGADTVLVVRSSAAAGARAGILTTVGICSGLFVHAALSALGLSLVLLQSATAFSALKLAGAAYLGWLGLQSLRAAASPKAAQSSRSARRRGQPFVQGLLTNLLNPKVAVFYLALLPQFIGPNDPVLLKSLFLASLHWAMGLVWLSIVSLAVSRSRQALSRSWLGRSLQAATGALLVGLGAKLVLAEP